MKKAESSQSMTDEWRMATLQDVCELITDGSHYSPKEYLNGMPMASVKDLTRSGISLSEIKKISVEDFLKLKKQGCMPHVGDVLIAKDGNSALDTVCVYRQSDQIILLSSIAILRPNNEVCSDFLCYYLDAPITRRMLKEGYRSGSAIPRVILKDFRRAPIFYPPVDEQKAIAHILSTLDDKIELNRKMNTTLEEMARAIFKSWFVDFEPVRAKIEGRWQHGQSLPGLPADLFDLFPDKLVDSELGEIPEGWEVGKLDAVSSLNPEIWNRDTRPAQIEYIDLSNTKWGRIEEVTLYDSTAAPSRAQRVLRPGDTIVGTVRPGNGSYALIAEAGLTGSTGFAVLRPKFVNCKEFIYLAVTYRENIEALAHLADGGAYPAVRPEVVAATECIIPNAGVLSVFSRLIGTYLIKIANNERQSRTLASLRDTLLPKLISGQIRVKDAERFLKQRGL